MRLAVVFAAFAASITFAAPAFAGEAQQPPAPSSATAPPAPDYASEAAWACRPGKAGPCTADLDALKVANDGARTPDPFHAAADPGFDCFYVYPTASSQPGDYAEPRSDEAVDRVVRNQAARLAARCRVFAPYYRQLTSAGLDHMLQRGGREDPATWATPYLDVRAAWRRYLEHDNAGRGVVLVGHSQGSILLASLLAREIETGPARARVISAVLAGHPAFLTPKGADVGGTLKVMPLCRARSQSGCVVVWSSYAADMPAQGRFFARDHGGLVAACVNPAAPDAPAGAAPAPLHPVLTRPSIAPDSDPPFVEPVGQLSGACVADGSGSVLQVTVAPGRYQGAMGVLFSRYGKRPGWGLHALDVALVEDDIVDLIGEQAQAWKAAQAGAGR